MPVDTCSFDIGENTLLEIERQAILINTPLSSRNQKDHKEHDDEIIEESPNAKECSSVSHLSIHERLKNATQRNRRKLEKSKSSSAIGRNQQTRNELSSISKYLHVEESFDMSAWERSAAKLISPAVNVIRSAACMAEYDHTMDEIQEEIEKDSQDLFSEQQLDQAISGDISINNTADIDLLEHSHYNMDNVTFMQPRNNDLDDQEEVQRHIELEIASQKSLIKADAFLNESIFSSANNFAFQQNRQDQSLTLLDTTKNLRFLSSWNLPPSIVNEYRKKNVTEMFEWQCECLKNPKVLFEGANLVYSAPTSAGKVCIK